MTDTTAPSIAFHGLEAIELHAADGARAIVTLHGGHVVSWTAAGSEVEQLYLSPRSDFADGRAIRGGVPVIFPQFSNRGPLVRHGFARTRAWRLVNAQATADGGAMAMLRLVDDGATRALWPHAFALDLSVHIGGNTLVMDLACTNTGERPFECTVALHTYLAVGDVAQVHIDGLGGRAYWDAVFDTTTLQDTPALRVNGEIDRVYHGVDGAMFLHDPRAAEQRTVQIDQQGFADVVVWNPGAERCAVLADMPPDGYRTMLCIEAAAVGAPITLAPGAAWRGTQRLQLR